MLLPPVLSKVYFITNCEIFLSYPYPNEAILKIDVLIFKSSSKEISSKGLQIKSTLHCSQRFLIN